VLTNDRANEWINSNLIEKLIQELATSHPSVPLKTQTIIRNFREVITSLEPFEYSELPPLKNSISYLSSILFFCLTWAFDVNALFSKSTMWE
jgi:hypothetical protein